MKFNPKKTKQPSKQRKKFYTAPLHKRRKQLTAPLADMIAEKEGVKRMVVREGDSVRIRKGSFKGIEGEVSGVDYKNMHLIVEGVTFEKTDGSTQHFPVRACNCEIIELKNMKDKNRQAIVSRRQKPTEEEEE
jgi:large subunit ribosomal protein L24